MAVTKTAKTTTTAKAPAQTKLPVVEVKKPAAESKADAKKEEAVKKTETPEVKKTETPAAKTTEEAAKPVVRRGRKPGSTNKKTTRKTTTTRKTAKKDTTDEKTEVFVQFAGQEFSEKSIMEKVVAAWQAEGKKASAIKKAKLYVKPEDSKAYYVINEGLKNGSTGAVDL